MELQITHIRGQIGINTRSADLSIRQPMADMEITTTKPQANAKIDQVRIKIDQSQCFNEAGLKNVTAFRDEITQRGKAAVIKAIASTVDEGNRMAMIKNKSNAIAEIAAEKTFPPPADFNIVLMPQSRPKIVFEGGFSFSPEAGTVNIYFKPNKPEIEVTRGSVETYLLQRPYFKFEFIGNNVDVSA
jgi:hypothetical protein